MSVSSISPHLSQIECPDQLRKLKGWLIWRYEQRPGEAKPRKVPYYAGGGRRGAHGTDDDRNKLVTFDAAIAAAARKGFDGVGLAMLQDWGMVALDFDNAVSGGAVREDVELMLSDTYAEFSPSGLGVRAFVRGIAPNKKSFDEPYGFETFCSSGFVTFTGNRLPMVDLLGTTNVIAPMNDQVRQLIADRLLKGRDPREKPVQSGERLGYTDEQLAEMLKAIDPDEHGYDQWYQIGMALHHETDAEGFDLWDEWSSNGGQYPGRDELQRKWDSFGRNAGPSTTIRALMKWAGQAGATVGGPIASADDFDVIEDTPEELEEKKAKAARFAPVPAAEILKRKPPGWLVKDTIPDADLVLVYGASGSGKSFVMIDLAMALARGVPWFGRKVRQCPVVYVCAEGAGGFGKRLKAYAMQQGLDLKDVPIWVIEAAPNLLKGDDIKSLVDAIRPLNPAIVIMDTLARMTAGANENAGEDMGLAIDNCSKVTRATGARVFLVHHTGKDESKGARGWSGMRAAADAEFEVVRDKASGKRWIETTKEKDTADEGRIGFQLETVIVDLDEDGDPVTSCVVAVDEAPAMGRARKVEGRRKLGPWEEVILETFAELQLGGDVRLPELVINAAEKRADAGTVKNRRKNAKRALLGLTKGKDATLMVEEEYVFEVQN
jgi:hypothetical protein